MSLQVRNQISGALERVAGFNDTDSILSPSSQNPISNRAVYAALAQKIDKTVTDLINYYDKTQVYSKPEVRALIGSINTLTIEVVSQLPTQDISTTTIYFVGPAAGTNNYDEYVYVGGNWVQIGDTTIDLSNYVTSANLTTVLQDYYTKSQADALFDDYYDKDAVDDLLDTKQNTLDFDNTPIAGSQNPVTSAGIKTALDNILISGNGGSIIKVHHLAGAAAAGNTVTASKGDYSVSSTFDVSGDAIIIGFGEIGHITITCSNGSETGTTYIDIPSFSSYSTVISYGLDYVTWLTKAGIDASYYESLDDIFADEEAVRKLMTKHASVDYLATVDRADDEMALAVFNNDICAKWINLRDYALDTLYANDIAKAMMDDADKYGYGEWALVGQVPTMTSNTAPYGVASASSEYNSSYQAWKAFSGTTSDEWSSAGNNNLQWIQYQFITPIIVKKVMIYPEWGSVGGTYYNYVKQCQVQASNDGTNWINLTELINYQNIQLKETYIDISNDTAYIYYRIANIDTYAPTKEKAIRKLQFYAWQPKGNVPVMTSNTAPYGEAIGDASSNQYLAFDNSSTTAPTYGTSTVGHVIGYKFTNPVCVKKILLEHEGVSWSSETRCKFQASSDGTTWEDLTDEIILNYVSDRFQEIDIDNNEYYLYYRKYYTTTNRGSASNYYALYSLQFYGREMKVSVPAMTDYAAPYGTITSSTDYTAGYNAVKAFDKQGNSTWWHSTAGVPQWIGYEFTKPIIVKMVEIKPFSSSSVTDSVTLKVQAFETSTNSWIDLSDLDVYSGSVDKTFSVNNENAYSMYRIYSSDTSYVSSGSKYVRFNTIQFYGFDYSERDWDTEHPMKYIYDHGVELEPLVAHQAGTGNAVIKDADSITLYKNTTSSSSAYVDIATTNKIDFTDYSLMRVSGENALSNAWQVITSYANIANARSTDTVNSMLNNMPSNNGINCSAVNNLYYAIIGLYYSQNALDGNVTEWWLEQ